jgi:UDP-N-acetylglucosamine acyltransferase
MTRIHPTAIIDPAAQIGEDVVVGPYCVVDAHVRVGARTVLKSHVVLTGHTTIGQENVLHPGVVLGSPPQDKSYKDEPTRLVVGDRNQIREHVTFHVGTMKGGGITRVGSDGLFMVGCHVAHDGQVGDFVVMANHVLLAGHVIVEDRVTLNGAAAAHHFARIGRLAYIGGMARISRDVPPFCIAEGALLRIRGANVVGMRRAGFSPESVERMRDVVYRVFVSDDEPVRAAMERVEMEFPDDPLVTELVQFQRAAESGRNGRAHDRRPPSPGSPTAQPR